MTTPAARRGAGRRPPAQHNDLASTVHPAVVTDHTVNTRGQIKIPGSGVGLGTQWAGSRVTSFRTDDHLLVFHRDELIRELVIDPTRNYQPTGAPRGGHRRLRITDTLT